jgi:phosphoserine phosphatase RsbU/P
MLWSAAEVCRQISERILKMLHWFRSSLDAKVTAVVLLSTSLVLSLVLSITAILSRSFVRSGAETQARQMATTTAETLADELSSVATATRNLAYAIETGTWDDRSINHLLITIVQNNRDIFGSTISFAPFEFDPGIKAYAPYYYKGKEGITFVQLADSYNYFEKEWFKKPVENESPFWSDPYFDEGGGQTLMITYSCPFFKTRAVSEKGPVRGVITADVSLDHLTEMVSQIKFEQTGYAFLVSNKGELIVWPQKDLIMRETILGLAQRLNDARLTAAGKEMLNHRVGFFDAGASLNGKDSFLAFSSLPTFGWRLGVVIPKDELFAQTYLLERILFLVGVAGILLLFTASLIVSRSITAPLKRVASVTGKVGQGQFDVDFVEKDRTDEIGQLARSFISMTDSLKTYMEYLTQATAKKERIESELRIAADIQRSMLPSNFPAFPERNDFDIYAVMRPAKEVGGDFFDFFLLDSDHLCVSVGDVSGKGTPAALFMAVTKYLIEASVGLETTIDRALEKVNSLLVKNNDSCMFVTVFIGVLNLKNGEMVYANAGHNSPIIWAGDQKAEFLEAIGGPILGIVEPGNFRIGAITFKSQEALLIYTDGVTEAFDVRDEAFSDEKLIQTVNRVGKIDSRGVTEQVLLEVDKFCDGVPQSDDITIMVLRYTPET